jgi:hypothetical protein
MCDSPGAFSFKAQQKSHATLPSRLLFEQILSQRSETIHGLNQKIITVVIMFPVNTLNSYMCELYWSIIIDYLNCFVQ